MKSKIMRCAVLSTVGIFALFNAYQFQLNNKENLTTYKLLLQTKNLLSGIAFAEGLPDFPEDPNNGENLGKDGYEKRRVLQYYYYDYIDLNKTENGEKIYSGYKTPTTKVVCEGRGNVACYTGEYIGISEFLGEVKESEKKQNVFE